MKIRVFKEEIASDTAYPEAAKQALDSRGWWTACLDVDLFEEVYFHGQTEAEARDKALKAVVALYDEVMKFMVDNVETS